jgi:hypothetical protein
MSRIRKNHCVAVAAWVAALPVKPIAYAIGPAHTSWRTGKPACIRLMARAKITALVEVAPAWCKKAFSNRTRTELSSYLDAGRD